MNPSPNETDGPARPAHPPFADRAFAAEMSRRGVEARRAVRKRARDRVLDLDTVSQALGPLATPEDAQRQLGQLARWCAAGQVPGAAGSAAVRAVEIWLKAHGEALDRGRMAELGRRIKELEAELVKARGGARPRVMP